MTNKLVVINSLKVPKIKKLLLYEMKFLVPNYSCLQNPWLGGRGLLPPYPRSLSSTKFVETPRTKFLGTPLSRRHKFEWRYSSMQSSAVSARPHSPQLLSHFSPWERSHYPLEEVEWVGWREETHLHLAGYEPLLLYHPSCNPVILFTDLFRLTRDVTGITTVHMIHILV